MFVSHTLTSIKCTPGYTPISYSLRVSQSGICRRQHPQKWTKGGSYSKRPFPPLPNPPPFFPSSPSLFRRLLRSLKSCLRFDTWFLKKFSLLSGTMQCFSCSWSDVGLFLFLLIFPAFIDQTRALHQVFLLIVCATGVKISRIFFESDEYLCPLTAPFYWVKT